MKRFFYWLILVSSLVLIIPPLAVRAATFNSGYIISDLDLFDEQTLTLDEIKLFLQKKNSTWRDRYFPDKKGVQRLAAEIIWLAAQAYKISPKFLLVLLQKEQSLVEDGTPTAKQFDWAMGYGVCDACDPDDAGLAEFKGFGVQIDRASWRQRWYIENKNLDWLKKAGKSYLIDGQLLFLSNQATANLYNYTPHLAGNYLFWKIWNRWFTQKYADGSLLQIEGEKGIWLIQGGMKRPFFSKSAFLSRYNFRDVIIVGKIELDKYELGTPIKFANYSRLKTPFANYYLLQNDYLRKFESAEVMRLLGFNPEEFEKLDLEDFARYPLGEPITLQSAYPTGALLQDKTTGGVFYVQDGRKYPIITKDILKINFPQYHLTMVSPEELEKYPRHDPIKLKDGMLIKVVDQSAVYVIAEGKKRPIVSGAVFERLGYKWDNVKVVSEKSLSNLSLGAVVELEFINN